MATLHVVSALTKKHSEIQGEIQLMESKLEDMHNILEALETSVMAFDTAILLKIANQKRYDFYDAFNALNEIDEYRIICGKQENYWNTFQEEAM